MPIGVLSSYNAKVGFLYYIGVTWRLNNVKKKKIEEAPPSPSPIGRGAICCIVYI